MEDDLSRRVAKVMGWRRGKWGRDHVWERETEHVINRLNGEKFIETSYEVPDYASDLNLAMIFLESIDGFLRVTITPFSDDEWFVRTCFARRPNTGYYARDKNLAAAICKAGLRAWERSKT